MALSEDQKAMLRLLAQRQQGYEDIAALMGLSAEEVRAKAKEAAAQMEAEGLPAPALPPEPEGPEPAEEPKPEAPAPKAELRAEAPVPPPPRKDAAKPPRPRLTLPSDPGVRGALAAAALVVVALVVVLIVSGGDGDSSGEATPAASNAASEGAPTDGEGASVADSQDITKAVLEPVGGGGASGVAIFGREGKSLALQVEATGLEPPGKGQSYAIWLAQSPQRMLPLAAAPVSKSGRLASQFRVPVEVLGYLANETFTQMAITLVDNSDLDAALKRATKAKESPDYTGTAVLRGEVTGPIVGAAKQ